MDLPGVPVFAEIANSDGSFRNARACLALYLMMEGQLLLVKMEI